MYRIIKSDQTYTTRRYATEEQATKALARRKEVGSAVVWFDDTGVPKVWCGYWTSHGWNQSAPVKSEE